MSEPIVYPGPGTGGTSGVEVQLSDLDNMGAVGGLADDRVLAELLRMQPYTIGGVVKAAIPFSTTANTNGGACNPSTAPIVQPSGAGNGSILVNPFRGVIGSRNALGSAPSPNPAANYQTPAMANWRDIRSAVFVGNGAAAPGQLVPFANNASGTNSRWDLVFAQVSVDAQGPTVSRRIKNPNTGTLGSMSVAQYINTVISIAVVTGTPGTSPVPASLPADSGGVYNIPLAWVRIPPLFSSVSTVATGDIRTSTGTVGSTQSSMFRSLVPGPQMRPASGSNDNGGSYALNFPWSPASGGGRPGPFMPQDWVGGDVVMVDLDFMTGGSYSHPNNALVDASIDWRNRYILAFGQGTANKFGHDTSGGPTRMPVAYNAGTSTLFSMGNSFAADAFLIAGGSTVFYASPANCASLAAGSAVGLYVSQSTGQLLAFVSSTVPTARLTVMLQASAQFPNV